jgi:hypothetical protein
MQVLVAKKFVRAGPLSFGPIRFTTIDDVYFSLRQTGLHLNDNDCGWWIESKVSLYIMKGYSVCHL